MKELLKLDPTQRACPKDLYGRYFVNERETFCENPSEIHFDYLTV